MEATMIFNDKIIFLSDISYIERRTTKHKKREKDSAGQLFLPTTYDIIMYLKSGRTITTWYPYKDKRDKDYQTLLDAFNPKKQESELFNLFGFGKKEDNKEE